MNLRGFVRLFAHIQLLPVLENGEETTLVGGQAVMEGVMMRSPHSYCVAVRTADGTIVTEESPLPRLSDQTRIFRLPVIRGLGTLGHAMWLGMKALSFQRTVLSGRSFRLNSDRTAAPVQKSSSGSSAMILQILFSLAFMIGMYKFLPLYLATKLGAHFRGDQRTICSQHDRWSAPNRNLSRLHVLALANEGDETRLRISRSRTQGRLQLRIRSSR